MQDDVGPQSKRLKSEMEGKLAVCYVFGGQRDVCVYMYLRGQRHD